MELFTEQKWREERQVKIALAGMGLERHAAYVRRSERPDFIMPLGGQRIGIEHTEFFFSEEETGVPRQFQNERHQSIETARRRFRANGGPALFLTAVFGDNPVPMGPRSRREREDFAQRFERVVRQVGWPDTLGEDCVVPFHPHIPEIACYMVTACSSEAHELWACGGPVTKRQLDVKDVQGTLDKKSQLHEDYAQNCDSVWLVIVNGGAIRTVACELGDEARHAAYSSPFDRVIWLDRFPPRPPVRLKVTK